MNPAHTVRLVFAPVLAILLLSACGPSVPAPDVKQNAHPVKRYVLTITVENAPGPLDSVGASVDYQVTNDACVPLQPISGARLAPHRHVPIDLRRVGSATYEGSFFADLMQDADYYGLGTCRWQLVAAGAALEVHSVEFSPSLFRDDVIAQKQVATYFPVATYNDPVSHGIVTGQPRTAQVGSHPDRFFSVTLASKERF